MICHAFHSPQPHIGCCNHKLLNFNMHNAQAFQTNEQKVLRVVIWKVLI